jgi:ribosome-associated protein
MNQSKSILPRAVLVRATPIGLCQFIKFGGLTGSGGEAKRMIAAGGVRLNGVVETRRSRQLVPGDQVTLDGQTIVVQVGS